jgi:hypothetical protein
LYQLYKLYQALYQPLAIYHPNRGKLDGAARKSSKEAEVIDPELLEAEAKEAKARKYGGAAWSRWRLGGFSIQQKCIEMLHECILNYFDVFSKFQDADLKTGFAWFDGECARDLYIIIHIYIYMFGVVLSHFLLAMVHAQQILCVCLEVGCSKVPWFMIILHVQGQSF